MTTSRPELAITPAANTTAVALVLHGGREDSFAPAGRHQLAYLRMLPFARALQTDGLAVWVLRNRYRGWNEPHQHPVADARWALERIHAEHPDLPVALVGHSMGGRVALRVADDPAVAGVCALAPWTTRNEPVDAVAGRTVLIAHGDRERMTDPALSLDFARRAKPIAARIARFDVRGDGHAMLRRAADWTALVRGFTLGVLGLAPMPPAIEAAFAQPDTAGLTVPLASR